MPYNYFIFANPNGKNVTSKKRKLLRDIFSSNKQFPGKFIVTENLSKLEKKVQEHRSEANNNQAKAIVGIVGGDGTVMHTRTMVENIWGYNPMYAFFPEGTMNNIHRTVGLVGDNSSVKLAKHIVTAACTDTLEHYLLSFPSLDVNGKKGFNIGFGLIPKLLWLYYGHSAKQYRELEEALQTCREEQFEAKYKEITGNKEKDFFDLLSKERGLWGAAKTVLRLLNGVRPYTDERYLLHKPISGDIKFDNKVQDFPKNPLGVYISCYEEVNLGLGPLNPVPSPEARIEEGKFQVVVPYGNPFAILSNLPKLMSGKKLSRAAYRHASSAELSEKCAQVDGEILLEKGFLVKYDGLRKLITLPVVQ